MLSAAVSSVRAASAHTTCASMRLAASRAFASATDNAVEFDLRPFKTHMCDGPGSKTTTTRDELMDYFTQMSTIRRMEIACDNEYKVRNIRGFCHLYDGQEAVAMGVQAATTNDDDWITSYRCHGASYLRGDSVESIMAEMFGLSTGVVKGKGGSMHLYNKASNFYGGAAIVGAQVPVGAGLAFAQKYLARLDGREDRTNVSMTFYGDGAANQGQCWEAANMAKLWGLPCIFVIENNMYGMGTSVERHSGESQYYKYGAHIIPGVQCDGMDVLSVRETFRYAREHCSTGNGPMFVEVKTYRYHGHSMSDPGLTYRDRDEVADVRASRDCIATVKNYLLEAELATDEELKKIEKSVRKEVASAVKAAKKGKELPLHEMYTDIYQNEVPQFIRGVQIETSAYDGRSTLENAN